MTRKNNYGKKVKGSGIKVSRSGSEWYVMRHAVKSFLQRTLVDTSLDCYQLRDAPAYLFFWCFHHFVIGWGTWLSRPTSSVFLLELAGYYACGNLLLILKGITLMEETWLNEHRITMGLWYCATYLWCLFLKETRLRQNHSQLMSKRIHFLISDILNLGLPWMVDKAGGILTHSYNSYVIIVGKCYHTPYLAMTL